MHALVIVAWTLAIVACTALGVLSLECLIALIPRRKCAGSDEGSVVVLIPAHNEAAGIAATIRSLQSQLREQDRILVVADNCRDDTAAIARTCNAEVLERFHEQKRGKGYALDAGIRHLEAGVAPDVVVVLDADCELERNSIRELVRCVQRSRRPAQAVNLIRPPADSNNPAASISVFAFLVKNWVRPRAIQTVGLPISLTGTGMAFPWHVIQVATLASGEIVEDLALGISLTLQGNGAVLCDAARVWSDQAVDPTALFVQRTRWEHGYLSIMARGIPRLIAASLSRFRPSLLLVALDLAIPPLALLASLSIAACGLLAILGAISNNWAPFFAVLASGIVALGSIALAWFRFARDLIPIRVFVSTPKYVLMKLRILNRFFADRQVDWIRTQRAGEPLQPEGVAPLDDR